jgi:hypothetical protein
MTLTFWKHCNSHLNLGLIFSHGCTEVRYSNRNAIEVMYLLSASPIPLGVSFGEWRELIVEVYCSQAFPVVSELIIEKVTP